MIEGARDERSIGEAPDEAALDGDSEPLLGDVAEGLSVLNVRDPRREPGLDEIGAYPEELIALVGWRTIAVDQLETLGGPREPFERPARLPRHEGDCGLGMAAEERHIDRELALAVLVVRLLCGERGGNETDVFDDLLVGRWRRRRTRALRPSAQLPSLLERRRN